MNGSLAYIIQQNNRSFQIGYIFLKLLIILHTDLCTPWKGFQYSENKFPYSAIIFRSVIFFSGATCRRNRLKKEKRKEKKVAPPTAVNGK